jgi:hypothetical protein
MPAVDGWPPAQQQAAMVEVPAARHTCVQAPVTKNDGYLWVHRDHHATIQPQREHRSPCARCSMVKRCCLAHQRVAYSPPHRHRGPCPCRDRLRHGPP